jgi:predicted ester cyclase
MSNSLECELPEHTDIAGRAKQALELVCSGKAIDSLSRYYSEDFIDHVNGIKLHGLAGARRSVESYMRILSELEVVVQEQLTEGNRVTSRFIVSGKSYGRRVRINGITISRFKDGLIVEDWSVTDALGMLRQMGAWRALLVFLRHWK